MLTAKLVDTSKCMGCRGCQVACKQWNRLPAGETAFTGYYENPVRYTANTWTRLVFREHEDANGKISWFFSKQGCMHCNEAACEKVCPTGAITHSATGAVVINRRKCIGCNFCVASCTFHVMSFNQRENVSTKCTLCTDRQAVGLTPACAKTCPTGAITFGLRTGMVSRAHARVSELVARGVTRANIYGLTELDGTNVMYVLEDSPAAYGLPEKPGVPVAAYVWNALFRPLRVVVVLALGLALWNNKRKTEAAQSE
jgi:formate dehydrogenase iron-sulfur subunit